MAFLLAGADLRLKIRRQVVARSRWKSSRSSLQTGCKRGIVQLRLHAPVRQEDPRLEAGAVGNAAHVGQGRRSARSR